MPNIANISNNILTDSGVSTANLTPTSTTISTTAPLQGGGDLSANRTLSITQASGSQNGYLSSSDWTTFNNKQAAGNYITSLTGEATASGPGSAAVTLNNASVTAKILTGVNITGGSISATDTMLTAFGKLQNQINGLVGGSIYQGTWNASTNTPSLASGVGTKGYYYIVSVAGTTNLDGITDWNVGDWAIFDGTSWQQVDNTDAVVSVNGQTGAVSLTTDNIPEGATNQYFLNSRARAALSFTAGSGAYNNTTGVITIPTNTSQLTNGANFITLASLSGTAPIGYNNTTGVISITQAGASTNGYLSSTDWNTFNSKQAALSGTGFVKISGTTISYDNSTYYLASNPSSYIALTALSSTATGLTYNNTTGVFSLTTGYSIPTNTSQTNWDNAYNYIITSAGSPLNIAYNTITISQSNTSTDGYLSSTDWNTFNSKYGGTGTTNYLSKFTGTSTIGNSNITDDGSLITLGSNSLINNGYLYVSNNDRANGALLRLTNSFNGSGWIAGDIIGSLEFYSSDTSAAGNRGAIRSISESGSTNSSITGLSFETYTSAVLSQKMYLSGAGSLGIGTTTLTQYGLRISKNITGSTVSYNQLNDGVIQSGVTSQAYYYASVSNTDATTFTLGSLFHYRAIQGTFGAGSTVTNQYGYFVDGLTAATNNYGYYSNLSSATGRWNLFMSGSADNYIAGNVGIGVSAGLVSSGPILTTTLTNGGSGYVDGTYTDVASTAISANGAYALFTIVVSGGIVTTATLTWGGSLYKVGDTLTVSNTLLGGTGSGLVITVATVDSSQLFIANANGADISLFRSDTSVATGDNIGTIKWIGNDASSKASGIYAELSANAAGSGGGAYLSFSTTTGSGGALTEAVRIGNGQQVGIGSTSLTGYNLRVSKNITGATTSYGVQSDGEVQSGVTSSADYYRTSVSTAAATFTLSQLFHYRAVQGTIGATSAVTSQFGFTVDSSLTGATNNYGFFGNIASGTNRWNIYMQGTANNYMAGSLGIGSTSLTGTTLNVSKNLTGASVTYGAYSGGTVQSDSTSSANYFLSQSITAAATFTVTNINHFRAAQGTFGAGSTVTNQSGFVVDATLIGATNNYGFFGNIPSGTNRWNLYMAGTAANYMAGSLAIGTTTISSKLSVFTAAGGNTSGFSVGSTNGLLNIWGGTTSDVVFDVTNGTLNGSTGTNLLFRQGGTTGMVFNASGRLLIGSTTDSGEQLQVTGTSKFTGAATFSSSVTASSFKVNTNGNGITFTSTGGADGGKVYHTGGDYLGLVSGGNGFQFKSSALSNLITITDGGNLLIGTTTDSGYKLNVNGSLYVSGSAVYAGGVTYSSTQTFNGLVYLNSTTHIAVNQTLSFDGTSAITMGNTGSELYTVGNILLNGAISQYVGFAHTFQGSSTSYNVQLLNSNITNDELTIQGGVRMNSTTAGFIPPRMTTTQLNALSARGSTYCPNGTTVFDTTINIMRTWNGTAWMNLW